MSEFHKYKNAGGILCEEPSDRKSGGRLATKARKAMPAKEFAGPDRSYPIDTPNRGRNALARVSQFGSPELKAKVRRKVHAKYPNIQIGG